MRLKKRDVIFGFAAVAALCLKAWITLMAKIRYLLNLPKNSYQTC